MCVCVCVCVLKVLIRFLMRMNNIRKYLLNVTHHHHYRDCRLQLQFTIPTHSHTKSFTLAAIISHGYDTRAYTPKSSFESSYMFNLTQIKWNPILSSAIIILMRRRRRLEARVIHILIFAVLTSHRIILIFVFILT